MAPSADDDGLSPLHPIRLQQTVREFDMFLLIGGYCRYVTSYMLFSLRLIEGFQVGTIQIIDQKDG
jgi:hypothetical protein